MKLYNSLGKQKQEFVPLEDKRVGIYSCGPTVYWNQHLGHMYAYTHWDTLVRYLRFKGYEVKWVMNITDVGHLTSDEDTGEDKMQKGAAREGISVWDLAEKYIDQFVDSMKLLNITKPDVLSRATDHIQEQIELAKRIQEKGFAYETKKGLVFDTSKFPGYADFAGLNLDKQKKRADVTDDPEKKLPWDFFLWAKDPNHIMKWDSPWGEGYPGWHIECTAMSTKYLGKKFDIHTGGVEHIGVHHTNEIAQGCAAFGEMTANFWLHNAWLNASGEKMSKSLGNIVTVQDLVAKGYDPLAHRYLVLTSHYRKGVNFSFEALDAAQNALDNLREIYSQLPDLGDNDSPKADEILDNFIKELDDDLNSPKAIAEIWRIAKSTDIAPEDKRNALSKADQILGIDIAKRKTKNINSPEVQKLLELRNKYRKEGNYKKADEARDKLTDMGIEVVDTPEGSIAK